MKNWVVFSILAGVTLLMRFHTLFPLTIDYDESTYAVIADHVLNGSALYKDVIDLKQPGIFILFGGIQLLFGKSILAIRLIAMLAVCSAAYFLYLFKRRRESEQLPSILSGVIFILMFNFYFGFSANAEIFFVWCVSLGLLIFQRANNPLLYLLSGLGFGTGFIIKQHVLFDLAAIGIFFFVVTLLDKQFKSKVLAMATMVVGFVLPTLLVHTYFVWNGNYDYFHFIFYEAPGNYSEARNWMSTAKFLFGGFLVYLPFIMLALLSVKSIFLSDFRNRFLLILLLCFDIIAVLITGAPHAHYYLQLALPISFAAGEIATLEWVKSLFSKKWVRLSFILASVTYGVFLGRFYHIRYIQKPNMAEQLYDTLKPIVNENTKLYTGDAPQVLYWLFDKKSPTPYVHSSILLKDKHLRTLEIDVVDELTRVYATHPDIIILSKKYRQPWFKEMVQKEYSVFETVGNFDLYRKEN